MFDLDSWQEIFATLRKNRLRTALTGLGVFLGIVILMVMVAFNRSMETGIMKQMAGFATNAVYVWGQRSSEPYAGLPPGREVKFNNSDLAALRQMRDIEILAPRNQIGGALVKYGGKVAPFQLTGDLPAVQHVEEPLMRYGRFLDDIDVVERRKVAVVGEGLVAQLFPEGEDPIGKYLQIKGIYFQVVGVYGTRQTGQQGDRKLNSLQVPFPTFQQAFNSGDQVHWFAITGHRDVSGEKLEADVKKLLAQRHKISPTDTMAIGSWNDG
jgi:putative ABC transport system permease protein